MPNHLDAMGLTRWVGSGCGRHQWHPIGVNLRPVVVLIAAALLTASCSAGDILPGKSGTSAAPFNRSISPLTGLKLDSVPSNPVYYVKIENTEAGTPQYGANQADMMMEELVEGGATRLIGMYYTQLPTKVGHVRSARSTDIRLSEPVNASVVASGGAPKVLRKIKKAGFDFFTYDKNDPGWSKDPAKVAPYHVLWNLQKLNETAGKTGKKPTRNYFAWGDGPADATKTVSSASVKFSPSSTTTWQLTGGKWHRANERAASGEAFSADTVVVIFCPVVDAGYNDPAGNPVPQTVVEGSGRAVVFSGGKAVEGTWHKPGPDATMTFTSKAGKAFGLKPGHIWFEVVPRGGSVAY
jgi:hypothetical protein